MPPRPITYERIKAAIQATNPGQEAAMYPWIRDLLCKVLGHAEERTYTDISIDTGGRPDVSVDVRLPAGILLNRWIVVEAKEERGIFRDSSDTQRILDEKWRYVGIDTEWFVCIDPETIRVRPVRSIGDRTNSANDRVFELGCLTEATFQSEFASLTRTAAAESPRLTRFREGHDDSFGYIRLENQISRDLLVDALINVRRLLNDGIASAWRDLEPVIAANRESLEAFHAQFGDFALSLAPFSIRARHLTPDQVPAHRAFVRRLSEASRQSPVAFRLAAETVPRYNDRVDENAIGLLLDETASFAISRMLMLRFFEDSGFLGGRHYLCNGGIYAFHQLHAYFRVSYPWLLRFAYQAGGTAYRDGFLDDALDWPLHIQSATLSACIERALMLLAAFDFTTIREDVLTSIYASFFEARQRKAQGEHYTPPSIARYIVSRLNLDMDSTFLDPACGFGTFVIEAYEQAVGNHLRRLGIADGSGEIGPIENFRGNDLNAVSAAFARMQMLWSLLPRLDPQHSHVPPIAITGGFDSLRVARELFDDPEPEALTPFGDLDDSLYDAVGGNPPYVRPERRDWQLTDMQRAFFREVGAGGNLLTLFLYKALRKWLRDRGRVGFIVQSSLLDGASYARFRERLQVGIEWTLCEVVDLEEIARDVFPEAKVVPIIVIIEKRPAEYDDEISFRVADRRVVRAHGRAVEFDLESCVTWTLRYADAFSNDGRIYRRVDRERLAILRELERLPRFEGVARRTANADEEAARDTAFFEDSRERVEPIVGPALIREGVAFRNAAITPTTDGYVVYNGENIAPGLLTGPPEMEGLDVAQLRQQSVWRFPTSLPPAGFAFRNVALNLVACSFDPRSVVFKNTAQVFIPSDEIEGVPIDIIVHSSVYQWIYGVAFRDAPLTAESYRSHIYARTIADLPWSETFVTLRPQLCNIRARYLEACRQVFQGRAVVLERLRDIGTVSLKEKVLGDISLAVRWPNSPQSSGQWRRVRTGDGLFDYFEINDAKLAALLDLLFRTEVLERNDDGVLEKRQVEQAPMPVSGRENEYRAILTEWLDSDPSGELQAIHTELDALVAFALGLNDEQLGTIQAEVRSDSLLRRLRVKLPFQPVRHRGAIQSLRSGERYRQVEQRRTRRRRIDHGDELERGPIVGLFDGHTPVEG